MHGQHILVALHHEDETGLTDSPGSPVDAVERAAFVEQPVVSRIDIFRGGVGGGTVFPVDAPCTETGQPPRLVPYREDETAAHGTEGIGNEGRGNADTEVDPGRRQFAVAGCGGKERAEESLLFGG